MFSTHAEALLLHEDRESLIAATAGGHLEHAGFLPVCVEHRPDVKALDQASTRDRGRQIFDRNAGLDAADVRLAQNELVEGDVARGRQGDFLSGGSHWNHLRDGRREPLSRT